MMRLGHGQRHLYLYPKGTQDAEHGPPSTAASLLKALGESSAIMRTIVVAGPTLAVLVAAVAMVSVQAVGQPFAVTPVEIGTGAIGGSISAIGAAIILVAMSTSDLLL